MREADRPGSGIRGPCGRLLGDQLNLDIRRPEMTNSQREMAESQRLTTGLAGRAACRIGRVCTARRRSRLSSITKSWDWRGFRRR